MSVNRCLSVENPEFWCRFVWLGSGSVAGQGQRIRPTLILKALSFAAFRAARGSVYKHIDPDAILATSRASILDRRGQHQHKAWPRTSFSFVRGASEDRWPPVPVDRVPHVLSAPLVLKPGSKS
ncbi:hypothetical protein TcasGA2_TC014426 [Tribolium castaneum]|uniref:Uncharacterized protein n=1 Tax=Tribolium castaneum TaxID=7070 RepID=D6WLW7_TRICA|nr:hypothetical protein TcasGA2_TC014426 [Tribolium castaneum]